MRVVSLLASGTEIVCGLGAGQWLVGRSHECDNPPWVTSLPECTHPAFDVSMPSGQIDAEVRRRLKSGEPLYHVDTELIDSLEPDLLITQEHCHVCAVTPADVKRAGCVIAGQVVALQAGSVRGIHDGIFAIGRALGLERKQAIRLVESMKSRIATVHDSVKPPSGADGRRARMDRPDLRDGQLGPRAGRGRQRPAAAWARKEQFSQAIDWQHVRDADPEWLIVAPCGFDLERTMREASLLESLPGWSRSACGAGRPGGACRR